MGKDPTTDNRGFEPGVPSYGESKKLPEKLSRLRQKLHEKAKQEPTFRFYTLYDRIYRRDTLEAAWSQVRANKGAAGVDGVTIDQIVNSEGGVSRFIPRPQIAFDVYHFGIADDGFIDIVRMKGRRNP